jgi:hypothetical protein
VRGSRGSSSSSLTSAILSAFVGTGLQIVGGLLRVRAEVLVRTFAWQQADPAASTVVSERALYNNRTGVNQTVEEIYIVNATTLAGCDAANFVVSVYRRTAAGVQTTIVQYTNNVASGGVVAWIPKSLGAVANNVLAPGDTIAWATSKTGAGQAIAAAFTAKLTTAGTG